MRLKTFVGVSSLALTAILAAALPASTQTWYYGGHVGFFPGNAYALDNSAYGYAPSTTMARPLVAYGMARPVHRHYAARHHATARRHYVARHHYAARHRYAARRTISPLYGAYGASYGGYGNYGAAADFGNYGFAPFYGAYGAVGGIFPSGPYTPDMPQPSIGQSYDFQGGGGNR